MFNLEKFNIAYNKLLLATRICDIIKLMFHQKKILTTAQYKMRKRDKDYRLLLPWNIRRTCGTFNIAHHISVLLTYKSMLT